MYHIQRGSTSKDEIYVGIIAFYVDAALILIDFCIFMIYFGAILWAKNILSFDNFMEISILQSTKKKEIWLFDKFRALLHQIFIVQKCKKLKEKEYKFEIH